jgi:uncharacterized protein (TIGR03437 family)
VTLILWLPVFAPAATLVRAPYLQNVSSTGATIMWTTRERVTAMVKYSVDGDMSRAATAQVRESQSKNPGESVFIYRAELQGLSPSRTYFYQIFINDVPVTDALRIRTAGPGPFTFLVFGDSGTGNDQQAAVARAMIARENPSLVLHTGDLSQESGTLEQLDVNYLGVYATMMARAPFFPSPGNHDYYTDRGTPCFSLHAAPPSNVPVQDTGRYYSFDWGNVHFVSLNSNLLDEPDAADRMLHWLEQDLQKQKAFWKIVYFHHLPYPTGHHVDDPYSHIVRERVVPIVEKYGVQLVLSGHEHSYQRTLALKNGKPASDSRGTVYVVTGGGGGVLHRINPTSIHAVMRSAHHYLRAEVRGGTLTLTAVGSDGEILDRHTLVAETQPVTETVVNAATFTQNLAGGSLISIFGRELAVEERSAGKTPLPLQMGGTSVTLGGERLPLLFVSPYQINAQLPYGFSGRSRLTVSTHTAFAELEIDVANIAPAVFEVSAAGMDLPALYRSANGDLISGRNPARGGEYLTLYATGLGGVDSDVKAGNGAPSAPLAHVLHPVEVRIGRIAVEPSFAGLLPGATGVYQINFRVPENVRDGANSLRIISNGVASEPVTLFAGPEIRIRDSSRSQQ